MPGNLFANWCKAYLRKGVCLICNKEEVWPVFQLVVPAFTFSGPLTVIKWKGKQKWRESGIN